MPGVINVYCILHNIWDSTGETLGTGKEQKVNISECNEMTKTEMVSPYAQRNRDAQSASSEGKGNDWGTNAQQPKSIYSLWFCQDLTELSIVWSLCVAG